MEETEGRDERKAINRDEERSEKRESRTKRENPPGSGCKETKHRHHTRAEPEIFPPTKAFKFPLKV